MTSIWSSRNPRNPPQKGIVEGGRKIVCTAVCRCMKTLYLRKQTGGTFHALHCGLHRGSQVGEGDGAQRAPPRALLRVGRVTGKHRATSKFYVHGQADT